VERGDRQSRNDQQVWQAFSPELDKSGVTLRLEPVTIRTPTYEYGFHHAWKNRRWHPVEPVSFDLVKQASILDKANRWIGRASLLGDSDKIGTLHMLVGSPRRNELAGAYEKAIQNMKSKITVPRLVIVEESEAAAFADEFAEMIKRSDTRH
jgi:hypothetical protein